MLNGCCADLAVGSDALWHNIAVLITKILRRVHYTKRIYLAKPVFDCLFIVLKKRAI